MEEVTGIVYLLLSPSGKKYIGRTIDLKRRLRRYSYESEQSSPVYLEIRKYGFDKFEVRTLFVIKGKRVEVEKKLNEKERFFISIEDPKDLLNVYRWDSNVREVKLSEQTKEKMSRSQTGRKHSGDSIKKRSGKNAYQSKRVRSNKLSMTFNSLKEAAEFAGTSGGCKISEVIKGKRKSAGSNPITKEKISDWEFVQ